MTKTAKTILGLIVAILVVWGIYSILQKSSEPVANEPIKVGVTFPLTGIFAFMGTDELEGVEFATKEINEKQNGINGRPLQIIIEDNEGDTKKAVSAFYKLMLEKPTALITAFTHITSALAPLAEQNQILTIYNSTINTFAEENQYVFKDYSDMEKDGKVMVKYLLEKDIKEIYVLSVINDAYITFLDSFKKEYLPGGGTIIGEDSFMMNETDFRTALLKIKKTGGKNILFNCGFSHLVIPFAKQMEEMQMTDGFTLAIPLGSFPQTIEEVGDILNKTNTVGTWFAFDENEKTNVETVDFVNKFEMEYQKKPNYHHAYTYDQTMILAQAMRICDNKSQLNSDCLRKQLLNLKNYVGVAGPINFDENGVSQRSVYLHQFGIDRMKVIKSF